VTLLEGERQIRQEVLGDLDARTRRWIGGVNGSGLRVAFYGALATLLASVHRWVRGEWVRVSTRKAS